MEQFHRNQAMIAHNWMAGWRTIPGLLPPPLPARPTSAALHQRQCRHWRHHHPAARTAALRQPAAQAVWCNTTKTATATRYNLLCGGSKRVGVAAPLQHPWQFEGDFLQTCEFGGLPSCVQWRRDPTPQRQILAMY